MTEIYAECIANEWNTHGNWAKQPIDDKVGTKQQIFFSLLIFNTQPYIITDAMALMLSIIVVITSRKSAIISREHQKSINAQTAYNIGYTFEKKGENDEEQKNCVNQLDLSYLIEIHCIFAIAVCCAWIHSRQTYRG